jgi:AraC-like DNA-binding protein
MNLRHCRVARVLADAAPDIFVVSSKDDCSPAGGSGRLPGEKSDDLGELCRYLMTNPSVHVEAWHPALRRAVSILVAEYRSRLSVADVAKRAFASRSYLSVLFRRTFNTNLTGFLARLRIEASKQMLANHPYMSITEVADASGFADLRRFERAFKRVVGSTPRDYRSASVRNPKLL